MVVGSATVKPGGKGRLRITFDSREHVGPIQTSTFVTTNDPIHRQFALELRGVVEREAGQQRSK